MVTEEIDEDIAEKGAEQLSRTLSESVLEETPDNAVISNSLDFLEFFSQFVPDGKYSLRLISESKDSFRKMKNAVNRLSQGFNETRPFITSL